MTSDNVTPMSLPPRPDVEEAVRFLRNWCATGPWVLTAIQPDQRGISSETFGPDTVDALERWIEARVSRENLYFTVNPLLRPMSGLGEKAKKADVRAAAWLHVDVDPRPNEPLDRERERAYRMLREFSPPPTVIVDSGGGYQGFWRLSEEFVINGDEAKAAEIEAYNFQIELTLTAATQCFNVDRIMRLPGTINHPNEKKRKKGRVPAPAHVAEARWDLSYPLTAFTAAPRVQSSSGAAPTGGATVHLSGNLRRLSSVDELPERVSLRTKMLIVQGDDPDDPTKYPSQSEAVFAVACELVRSGVEDDVIASVLLDEDFGISAHVRRQNRPQDYAVRQIRRAKENAVHPLLRDLNEKHAVIEDIGGKCRVISEVWDPSLKRSRLSFQSFDDFKNRYMHIMIDLGMTPEGKPIRKPLGKFWLEHPMRRQYRTVVFAPGHEVADSYNLWKGFSCEARSGDCSLFLQHVRENVCSGREDWYEYLINWMARVVQNPDEPGQVAVVLRGRMGTGKGKIAKTFGSLFGRHFLQVSDPKHLVGNFNAHLRDCVVLFGDEAFFAGDKRHESILKTLVTEETMMIELKGVDVTAGSNFIHLIIASNGDWVVPAGADERRYFILDVAETRAQDHEFFRQVDAQLDSGGREALLHMLLTRDLSSFEVRSFPKTEALQDQKLLSLSSIEEWWFERLTDGRLGRRDEWPTELAKDELIGDLIHYLERQKIMRRPSPTALGKFLKKAMPDDYPIAKQKIGDISIEEFGNHIKVRKRLWFYEVASLQACRALWDRRYGGPYNWGSTEIEEVEADKPPF